MIFNKFLLVILEFSYFSFLCRFLQFFFLFLLGIFLEMFSFLQFNSHLYSFPFPLISFLHEKISEHRKIKYTARKKMIVKKINLPQFLPHVTSEEELIMKMCKDIFKLIYIAGVYQCIYSSTSRMFFSNKK